MAAYGRAAETLKILPGLSPVIGRTRVEAQAKYDQLQELIHPVIGLGMLSSLAGIDLSGLDVDGPLPDDLPETNAGRGRQKLLIDTARHGNLTVRASTMVH